MINYSNAKFIKSATHVNEAPGNKYPEVLLCGKSNVGKSSFINALTNNKHLAYSSSKPGHTKLLNYFLIDNKFYLVDAPGYGYAVGGIDLDELFGKMMDSYFSSNNLNLVLLLLDSRRVLSDNDIELINYFESNQVKYCLIFTKGDKLNQKAKSALIKNINELGINQLDYFFTSILDNKSFENVKKYISNNI